MLKIYHNIGIRQKKTMTDNKNNRYHRGKIYAIRSHQTPDIYIGSTCNTLTKRLSEHKSYYKKNNRYYTSFEILKYPDYYIELIEEFKCENKMELTRREGEIIRATENCVNKVVAGRTINEWREENKEDIAQKKKIYYQDNKEYFSQKNKEYYEDNKEEIAEKNKIYRENNKEEIIKRKKKYYYDNHELMLEKKKKWRDENKELKALLDKKYYENNKEKILLKHKEKYTCECGTTLSVYGKPRHLKSKKHRDYLGNTQID